VHRACLTGSSTRFAESLQVGRTTECPTGLPLLGFDVSLTATGLRGKRQIHLEGSVSRQESGAPRRLRSLRWPHRL